MPTDRLSVLQICSARQAVYGAVQSLLTLAHAQREAGTRVEFVTFAGRMFGSQVREQGFAVNEVRVRGKLDPFAALRIRRVIREGRFDVVHTHLSSSSTNGCLAAKFARVPCVSTVHGMSGKLNYIGADRIIAVSGRVRSHLIGQGLLGSRIDVVYNGLGRSLDTIDRAEARRHLGIDPDVPVIGTVSRVTAMKAVEDGIRAFVRMRPEFPGLRYLVVGNGDKLDACRALAHEKGVAERVDFVGYQADVAPYLAAMDLFLFPTLKEAMGIALVEAMAAGVPCVSTDVGGIPEVVTHDVGVLVGPHQPERMAEVAGELLRDAPRRAAMGRAARARAEACFSAEAMEEGTDRVYRKLLGRGQREASPALLTTHAGPRA